MSTKKTNEMRCAWLDKIREQAQSKNKREKERPFYMCKTNFSSKKNHQIQGHPIAQMNQIRNHCMDNLFDVVIISKVISFFAPFVKQNFPIWSALCIKLWAHSSHIHQFNAVIINDGNYHYIATKNIYPKENNLKISSNFRRFFFSLRGLKSPLFSEAHPNCFHILTETSIKFSAIASFYIGIYSFVFNILKRFSWALDALSTRLIFREMFSVQMTILFFNCGHWLSLQYHSF